MGFERAGFKTIWANDFNADACKTHENWSTAKVVCGDVAKVDATDIPDADIMLGGFPCQGFSLSGPRKIDDSRNVLYKHYVRIVKEKKPLMFVGENVKGLLTMGGGTFIEAIVEDLSQCGYNVFYKLLNAKDYAVPEDRERVIIVGFRKDLNITEFEFPVPRNYRVTMREALKNIPVPEPATPLHRRAGGSFRPHPEVIPAPRAAPVPPDRAIAPEIPPPASPASVSSARGFRRSPSARAR